MGGFFMIYLEKIKSNKKIILNEIKQGEDCVIYKMNENDILIEFFYDNKEKCWKINESYDYKFIKLIPKEIFDNLFKKLRLSTLNFYDLLNLKLLFIYKNDNFKLFLVGKGNFLNSNRLDSEFYSNLIGINCFDYLVKLQFDYFKILAIYENDIIIQKYNE